MSGSRRPALQGPARLAALAAVSLSVLVTAAASANDQADRVRGFFCSSRADQIAFLTEQAKGENEEMAANAVNKSAAQASCAYYLPLTAVPEEEQTVVAGGLVFKLQKFVFLPEKSEHWAGSVFGSLSARANEQNI
ncbi:MAG: hypothetical protein WC807_11445 [Hyphomicrobium sp.]|jgi:hypothetical protein